MPSPRRWPIHHARDIPEVPYDVDPIDPATRVARTVVVGTMPPVARGGTVVGDDSSTARSVAAPTMAATTEVATAATMDAPRERRTDRESELLCIGVMGTATVSS